MVRCGASDSANVADQVGAGQRAGYPVVDGVAAGPFSSCYTSNQYRALQQFFKWWAEEEDRPDPMAGLHPLGVGPGHGVWLDGDRARGWVELSGLGRPPRA